jgi:hypothetical protein
VGRVVVSFDARHDLGTLIASHHLPADPHERVRRCLAPLAAYPLLGPALGEIYRYRLGPWPWMLLVYRVDAPRDTVVVVAIQDARRAGSATAEE